MGIGVLLINECLKVCAERNVDASFERLFAESCKRQDEAGEMGHVAGPCCGCS